MDYDRFFRRELDTLRQGAPSTCWTEVAIACDLDRVLVVTPQR